MMNGGQLRIADCGLRIDPRHRVTLGSAANPLEGRNLGDKQERSAEDAPFRRPVIGRSDFNPQSAEVNGEALAAGMETAEPIRNPQFPFVI